MLIFGEIAKSNFLLTSAILRPFNNNHPIASCSEAGGFSNFQSSTVFSKCSIIDVRVCFECDSEESRKVLR